MVERPNDLQNPVPDWVHERANRIVNKVGGTVEHAIDVILESEKAWNEASSADPNEPVRALAVNLHKSKKGSGLW